ncbi:MAG: hypothetical protein WB683_06240 [Candidatus Sulfotelmatobacter sp.]
MASVSLLQGFGQKAEDASFIDGGHRATDIGIAGQHDANGVGRKHFHFCQKLGPIHFRHSHVGDHHGIRPGGFERGQGRSSAGRRLDLKFVAKHALIPDQHGVFIVHHKNFFRH